MALAYQGVVKGNIVELPPGVRLPEGSEVMVVVGSEDLSWLKLAESTFARDWDNELDAAYNDWSERAARRARHIGHRLNAPGE